MDGGSRMIVLQNGVHDSYTWRKYGQKEILGARFPRSYYKCGRRPGCPAKKHVQRCDADPSKLEITYFEAHTCDDPPPSSSYFVPDPTIGSDALLVPVTTVPFLSAQCYVGRRPSSPPPHQVPCVATMIGSNVLTTTGLLPVTAVPGALHSSRYDPVPDVTDCTPSLEQEQAHDLLHIPSPACSQSELLPVEVAKLDCDFAVPEL
ncbi:transcription factor WRKY45-2-like [Miscanthus floridulus]|uniref:transcription factor WRKY45-2-like n=1 Tax=Miscanthus floridulus TaxID=154761 RepID=UPI00345ACC56